MFGSLLLSGGKVLFPYLYVFELDARLNAQLGVLYNTQTVIVTKMSPP